MDTDEPTRRDTSAIAPEPPEPAGWRPLVLVCVTGLIVVFNATVLSTAIGRVVADLGATVSQVQLAIIAYALMVTAFTVTGGKISGLLGAARTQLLGLGIYAAGMLVCFAAVDPRMLIAGEAVAGLGGALLIPNSLAILGQAYSGARRTFAISVQAGTTGIGAALALLVGGLLVQTWGWRAPFLLLLIALAVAFVIALGTDLPRTDSGGLLDVPSIALSAAGVLLLVIGINQAGEWGLLLARDASPLSLAGISPVPLLLVLGALALHAFLSRQRRLSASGRVPLLDPAVLSTTTARACLIGLLAINLLMAGTSYLLPLYTQIVLGKSPLSSAIMILPLSIAALLSATSTPMLMRRLPPRTLLIAAHLVSASGAALLALTVSNQWAGPGTWLAEILVGLGLGAGLSVGSALLMESARPELSGEVGSARGGRRLPGYLGGHRDQRGDPVDDPGAGSDHPGDEGPRSRTPSGPGPDALVGGFRRQRRPRGPARDAGLRLCRHRPGRRGQRRGSARRLAGGTVHPRRPDARADRGIPEPAVADRPARGGPSGHRRMSPRPSWSGRTAGVNLPVSQHIRDHTAFGIFAIAPAAGRRLGTSSRAAPGPSRWPAPRARSS
ncbi:MFS transporter [Rhodococcus zopfii]|uniref:MFS transporter n=1 Tax=Rhodococcus zopfii TaxID=43772 RepID=A0ABU3WLI9_9NOCA|nr:MFS transporter [Rhodococcus zopfii]